MYKTKIIDLKKDRETGIKKAGKILKEGGVVAFPTETVYGLGADALNARAVKKIFEAKGRPADNPLIVHISKITDVDKIAFVTDTAKKVMDTFWPGPITIVLEAKDIVSDAVTAGLKTVAVRMPENEYARELIKESGVLIAAPSANLSGRPSPTTALHVKEDLNGKIPLILDGGECSVGLESTVVDVSNDKCVILRPGGVTLEMLKAVLGDVRLNDGVLSKKEVKGVPKSPGMKYKHYAPRAEVFIVEGKNEEEITSKVIKHASQDKEASKKPVILCTDKRANVYSGFILLSLGQSSEDIAKRLFYTLREADDIGADTIYFEAIPENGIGLAVMNRVLKSAAFKKI
ncbi:MAG: L-threonylcarbamoyladenylate synthase [Eubacteriales bacterium]